MRQRSNLGRHMHAQVGEPAAAAALQAGLRPRALSRPELLRFAKRTQAYLEARNAILLQWTAAPTAFLTADACVGGCFCQNPSHRPNAVFEV